MKITAKHKIINEQQSKAGYTLVEVLIVTFITTIVMGQMVFSLVTGQRLLQATLADAHLSLQSRVLREKLLFHINEDGGLMNANLSELVIQKNGNGNGNGNHYGWGNGIVFKPHKGKKNRIMLGSNKRLKADKGNEKWLECGSMELQSEDVFSDVISNRTIQVNLDLVLPIGNQRYYQKHQIKSQIVNE